MNAALLFMLLPLAALALDVWAQHMRNKTLPAPVKRSGRINRSGASIGRN